MNTAVSSKKALLHQAEMNVHRTFTSACLATKTGPGLTSFSLKVIALILMTLDHIHAYIGTVADVPVIFGILGRIAAPLFLFTMAQGFFYTHSRKIYLTRMYVAAVLMEIANTLMNTYAPAPGNAMITNGIFATMFLAGVYICAVDRIIDGFRDRNGKKAAAGILLFLVPILLNIVEFSFVANTAFLQTGFGNGLLKFFMIFIPTPMMVEGGFFWILLAVGFYLLHDRKKASAVFYILITVAIFFTTVGGDYSFHSLFLVNYQWLMILALPFMLLYNGKKGGSMKYLFYLYYPLHVYALVFLARLFA